MNDSHVSVVSLNTVLSCQAYILFYSKVVPAPAAAPAAAPKTETAATATTVGAGEKASAASLGPAVLVRTPAVSAAQTLLPTTVVQTRERSNSEGLTSEKVEAEVAAQSSDCINALFADAAVTDADGASSENSEEAPHSRLHRGGFKFYAPYR
jgi:hypothetical protein